MAEDKFKAQARAILEGCPFNMEDAIANDLREAEMENQRLREDLAWALKILEQRADSNDLREQVWKKRALLTRQEKN
ncbi:MAG: hypothetical protein OER43_06960 [Gammaproteobacteria bacterium]|nr:hypothetical protein [Gammaproteobacteria bacterium]MDH3412983.1 hypothetical protein [Gammaproteobacteria bacterium]